MTWYGCYSLDLYCDNFTGAKDEVHGFGKFPWQYTAETGGECRSEARKAGWIVRGDGSAICPKCSGKKAKGKKE